MATLNAPSAAPVRKVAAATIGDAIAVIVLFVLSELGVEVNPALAALILTVITFVVGYLVPSAETDVPAAPVLLPADIQVQPVTPAQPPPFRVEPPSSPPPASYPTGDDTVPKEDS